MRRCPCIFSGVDFSSLVAESLGIEVVAVAMAEVGTEVSVPVGLAQPGLFVWVLRPVGHLPRRGSPFCSGPLRLCPRRCSYECVEFLRSAPGRGRGPRKPW